MVLATLAGCAEGESPPPVGQDEVDDVGGKADDARAGTVRVRVMAANTTSGNQQSYQAPGIRIFKGIAPDVVAIQEFNVGGNGAGELRAFVDEAFGPSFDYHREGGAQIPNGVVSRWPIVAAGEWDDPEVGNRDFAWARIDLPGPTDLWVVSVHLLTAGPEARAAEADVLLGRLGSIPAGAFVVVAGDFNTKARDEPALLALSEALVVAEPFPADHAGNGATNSTRAHPYDWVLANLALDALEIPVVVGSSTFPNGLVLDSRVYAPLAEIAPVQAGDSGAVNMQHMAVVRDFAVPTSETAPVPTVTVTAPNGGETWAAGSERTISWTATDLSSVKVEVALDGTSWQTVASSVPASAGAVGWSVPAHATTMARVRVSDAQTGIPSDTSDGTFAIEVAPPPPSGRVFLNEILANEPGSAQEGEFIEVVNGGGGPVDLGGWTLSDSRAVRHVFAGGTVLGAGRALVVYGHEAGIPDGVVDAIGSSTGLFSLTNAGDTVTLADASGVVVDRVTYGSSLGGRDGVSMNRDPDADPAGTFVLHDTLGGGPRSPGTRADGSPFGVPDEEEPPLPDPAITAESEPNDAAASADGPVGAGVAVAARIDTSTDADWYRVTLGAPARITISVAIDGSADLDWYLYRAENTASYLVRGYTLSNPETRSWDAPAGSYLVKVVGYRGAQAGYKLTVTGELIP